MFKTRIRDLLTATIAVVTLAAPVLTDASPADRLTSTYKNVIVMIPDGCGVAHFTLARWYRGEPLAIDALNVAMVKTYGSNSYITDSAPAATAMATGYKAHDKQIGVLPLNATIPGVTIPAGLAGGPVATVLEGARLSGRATGVIATSTVSHATPAGFTAHWYHRGGEGIITEQMAYAGLDVLFGGGSKHILTTAEGGARADGESLSDSLLAKGYSVVSTRTEMKALSDSAGKVWGQFNKNAMIRDIDRKFLSGGDEEPSLAEMTDKALKLLSSGAKGKDKGFFLLVEGSQVDWASHANDPVGVLSEYFAFDSAVTVAKSFAATNGNTLILVLADHDNGGLSLGSTRTDATYSSRHIDSLITAPLRAATMTGAGIEAYLGTDRSTGAITTAVSTYYGISNLTTDEINSIAAAPAGSMEYVLGPIMSNRTDMAWTTTGHTGNDLPLHYYGTDVHFGTIENTDIAWICAKAMEINMAKLNDTLFQKASVLFADASMTVDTVGLMSSRGSLTVSSGSKTALMPFNKNEMWINGICHKLNGLVLYSYTNHTVYVPKHALDIFNGGPTILARTQSVPNETFLMQNYPNPFNPSTKITVSLSEPTDVLVKIFDMSGALITTLINKKLVAGSHVYTWSPSSIASSKYICHMKAGSKIYEKMLTFTK